MTLRFQNHPLRVRLGRANMPLITLPLFIAVLAGCNESDPTDKMTDSIEEMEGGGAGEGPGDAGGEVDECAESDNDNDEVSYPLSGFVSNRVLWAQLNVTAEAARVVSRGRCSVPTVLEVDLSLRNDGLAGVDLTTRATWDLLLSDGTRVASQQPLGVIVERARTVSVTVRYEVDGESEGDVAALQLNGEERGVEQPELLRLLDEHPTDEGLRLGTLIGQVVELPDDGLSFEVKDASFSANDARMGLRAAAGERFVTLDVSVTVTDGEGQFVSDREHVSAIVEGSDPIQTLGTSTLRLLIGQTGTLHFTFPIDAEVERFAIEFRTRDGAQSQRLDVEIADEV